MDSTVSFRDFEERDIDSIFKWKNDEQLNSMIVGHFHPFTYDEAVNWVHGCMGEHETYKFWAVCTNDDDKRIVGWISLSNIDKVSKRASFHSNVIGDPTYRKGFPWIEIQQFILKYSFEVLELNKLEYSCLSEHSTSMFIGPVLFFKQEALFRQAVYKNGRYYDEAFFGLLRDEYLEHNNAGDYEMLSIVNRYAGIKRRKK